MNKPTIYLDMDGVIANFAQGYKEAFNRNAYEDDSFTVTQFCMQIPHLFRMLPVNDAGLELFNSLKDDYKIVFLTTPMGGMPMCKRDKIEWVKENIGNEYDVLFSDNKSEYVVDDTSVLIDDMEYNLKPWTEAGGTAIKFPAKIERIIDKIKKTFNPELDKKELTKVRINSTPTEKEKVQGNYLKGEVSINNLKIRIENTPGSIRWGFSDNGKWIIKMQDYYGYITGTIGSDNDPVDVFINPKGVNRSLTFVINQSKPDGMFDEVKCMIGYKNEEEAKKSYLRNYKKGQEDNIMSIVRTNTKKLRDWLQLGQVNQPFK